MSGLASRLSERVSIQQQVTVDDGFGGKTVSWTVLATVFAQVEPIPQNVRERSLAEQLHPVAGYRVYIRTRTDIDASMRLAWKTHTLQIHSLYNKLSADSVLMDMVDGVYDAVPHQAQLPYIVIGDGSADTLQQVVTHIGDCKMVLNVWTAGGGRKLALSILNRLHALLHQGTLNFTGFTLLSMRCMRAETQVDADNDRVYGVLELALAVRSD